MKKERIVWLDIIRTIAIILVVLCHATEYIYECDMNEWNSIGLLSKIFRTTAFTIGRIGVPLFLFITGYLILSKNFENTEDILKFYKKNLLPIVISTIIWDFIYVCVFYENKTDALKQFLFLDKSKAMNFWYMPMIIGIYIVLPYLSIIVKKIDLKALIIPMIIAFFAFFIFSSINAVLDKNLNFTFDFTFYGGIYGLYILLGYYIGKGYLRKINKISLIIIAIISLVVTVFFQFFLYNKGKEYNVWYNFAGIMTLSVSIFELFARANLKLSNRCREIFLYLSKISLSIFFIHIIIQENISEYIKLFEIIKPIRVIILFVMSFIISILITYILSKIKVIKTKVLLIKD